MIRRLALLALLASAAPLAAQTVTITSPNTVNPGGQPKQVSDVFVRNADGTIASVGGSSGGAVADVYGTGTINSATVSNAYTVNVANGQNVATFVLTGLTASGATVVSEASNDNGATWITVYSVPASTGIPTSTYTADGGFAINVGGRTRVRIRVTVAGSSTITVTSNLSVALREVRLDAPLPPGTNQIGLTGQGAAGATPWLFDLRSFGGTAVTLGQKTTAASIPVTLPSDGTYATSALQTAGNTSLSAITATIAADNSPTTNAQTIQSTALGKTTDAAATTTDTTATSLIAQVKQLVSRTNALITALGSPLQAGGTVAISQTTPGTTNGVTLISNAGAPTVNTTFGTDTYGATGNGLLVNARSMGFNGTTSERLRTLLATDMATGLGVSGVGTIPTSAASQALVPSTVQGAASLPAKTSAGNLFSVNLVNSTTAGFLLVANLTAAPASGTAIAAANQLYCMPVAASVGFDKSFMWPVRASTGITVLFSTSCTTYTPVSPVPTSITVTFQ